MRRTALLCIALVPLLAACADSERERLFNDAKTTRPPAAAPLAVGPNLPANAKLVPIPETLRTSFGFPETPFMPQLFELEYLSKYGATLAEAPRMELAKQLVECRAYLMDCRVVTAQ